MTDLYLVLSFYSEELSCEDIGSQIETPDSAWHFNSPQYNRCIITKKKKKELKITNAPSSIFSS